MYPAGFQTHVEPGALAESLEGAGRPGHFRGVTTVVTKLFGAIQPRCRRVRPEGLSAAGDHSHGWLPTSTWTSRSSRLPTVREPDGLAISSRNQRLGADDRKASVCVWQALRIVADAVVGGEHDAERLIALGTARIAAEPRARLEYLQIVDPSTLLPVAVVERPCDRRRRGVVRRRAPHRQPRRDALGAQHGVSGWGTSR